MEVNLRITSERHSYLSKSVSRCNSIFYITIYSVGA